MANNQHDNIAEILKTQISLTEWLSDTNHDEADSLKREDNDKRERLGQIDDIIGLPFDKPTKFSGEDLASNSAKFQDYYKKHKNELCALRLIPLEDGLPKLRMRGKNVAGAYEWFKEQNIDPSKYRADYIPHPPDLGWMTIFVIGENYIFGEIVRGGHQQLTQGIYEDGPPITFYYDFKNWHMNREDSQALDHLKKVISYIKVSDKSKQRGLKAKLDSTFSHDYIKGYWETADSPTAGLWFIDYNRPLGEMLGDKFVIVDEEKSNQQNKKVIVSGTAACGGKASGQVQVVPSENLDPNDFESDNILVCEMTTPDYIPIMQKCSAIVTDQGGILSHAAIVARELNKPCLVGTLKATKLLKTGQVVTVNADEGVVSE